MVVTDSSGRILVANPAFLALVHLNGEAEVRGQPLMGWLGLADQPLAALVPQVRRDGIVRRIESWVKPSHAAPVGVEISAALLTEGDQECIGFTIHPTVSAGNDDGAESLPHAALGRALRTGLEHLGGQLGALHLPAMLREATALAEQHFVQLALQRSAGDTSAAAALLGMPRDDLVRVLRRAGAPGADLTAEDSHADAS